MNVGIYGGSFNPIHLGHVGIAKRAIADLSLDRLLVVPANVSPFKAELARGVVAAEKAALLKAERSEGLAEAVGRELRHSAPTLTLWDRVELVKAAFRDIEKATVDLREIKRGGISYAIDTVREIYAEYASSSASTFDLQPSTLNLFFIIGEDSVEGLPRWKDIDELKKLCTFKAYPRTPESSTAIRKLFGDNNVTLNPDGKIVKVVRDGLVRKGGYCPCRLTKNPEFFCPCDEFKGQLADPSYHGLCHCKLYLKP